MAGAAVRDLLASRTPEERCTALSGLAALAVDTESSCHLEDGCLPACADALSAAVADGDGLYQALDTLRVLLATRPPPNSEPAWATLRSQLAAAWPVLVRLLSHDRPDIAGAACLVLAASCAPGSRALGGPVRWSSYATVCLTDNEVRTPAPGDDPRYDGPRGADPSTGRLPAPLRRLLSADVDATVEGLLCLATGGALQLKFGPAFGQHGRSTRAHVQADVEQAALCLLVRLVDASKATREPAAASMSSPRVLCGCAPPLLVSLACRGSRAACRALACRLLADCVSPCAAAAADDGSDVYSDAAPCCGSRALLDCAADALIKSFADGALFDVLTQLRGAFNHRHACRLVAAVLGRDDLRCDAAALGLHIHALRGLCGLASRLCAGGDAHAADVITALAPLCGADAGAAVAASLLRRCGAGGEAAAELLGIASVAELPSAELAKFERRAHRAAAKAESGPLPGAGRLFEAALSRDGRRRVARLVTSAGASPAGSRRRAALVRACHATVYCAFYGTSPLKELSKKLDWAEEGRVVLQTDGRPDVQTDGLGHITGCHAEIGAILTPCGDLPGVPVGGNAGLLSAAHRLAHAAADAAVARSALRGAAAFGARADRGGRLEVAEAGARALAVFLPCPPPKGACANRQQAALRDLLDALVWVFEPPDESLLQEVSAAGPTHRLQTFFASLDVLPQQTALRARHGLPPVVALVCDMSASLARLSLEERHILRYAAAARSAPMVVPMGHACPDCARAAAAATVCAGCGAKPRDGVKLRLCSACRAVAYCGDACRLTHWGEHKPACRAAAPVVAGRGCTAHQRP